MKQQMGMGVLKIGAALAIILLFVIIHLIAPEFLPELFALLASGDIPATVEYIRSFGEWAIVFAFLLTLFTNALGFPPAVIFSTANVILFGIVPGIILSCIAETVGVTIAFVLMRFYFRAAAEKATGRSIKVEIGARRAGDPAQLIASSEKARTVLGWKPQFTDVEQVIGTAWKWHESHPHGYED